jgi:hypothetical protein
MFKGLIFLFLIGQVYLAPASTICFQMVRESLTEQALVEQLGSKMHELKTETNQ